MINCRLNAWSRLFMLRARKRLPRNVAPWLAPNRVRMARNESDSRVRIVTHASLQWVSGLPWQPPVDLQHFQSGPHRGRVDEADAAGNPQDEIGDLIVRVENFRHHR